MGPACLSSSASYPILAVQPHAFLIIYLANFFNIGGKKNPSTWASFIATCGNLSHMLDAWGKKIPPEFLQCQAFTLDKPKCPCIGHWLKRSLSLLPTFREFTSFSSGKKSTYPIWLCVYKSARVTEERHPQVKPATTRKSSRFNPCVDDR